MDYVTVRELRDKSGEIWQRVETGEEFVVTRNGLPCALLLHAEPAEVEDLLRAHRAARLGAVVKRLQQQVRERGVGPVTDGDIQAEIDAVRRERAGSQSGGSASSTTAQAAHGAGGR
jgi:prevent-host-death family protein